MSRPKRPRIVTAPPPAPPPIPDRASETVQRTVQAERRRERAAFNRRDTILTNTFRLGVPPGERKELLGL